MTVAFYALLVASVAGCDAGKRDPSASQQVDPVDDGGSRVVKDHSPTSDAAPSATDAGDTDLSSKRDAAVVMMMRDAAVPAADDPVFTPTDCTLEVVPPAEACTDAECSVAFAGELSCAGVVGELDLLATPEHLFVRIGTSRLSPQYHVVARIVPERGELSVASPAQGDHALLRRAPDDSAALLVLEKDAIVVHRTQSFPNAWESERIAVSGSPIEAAFDHDARLHVFSVGGDAAGRPVTFLTLPPADAEVIVNSYPAQNRAVMLGTGALGFIYEADDATTRTVMLWTESAGATTVADLPPPEAAGPFPRPAAAPDWSPLPVGTGDGVLVSYVQGNALFTHGLPTDALPVLSWADALPGCDGMELVPPPDICSDERAGEPAGEHLVAHVLAHGSGGEPWLLALVGDAMRVCQWAAVGGCVETMTCDCRQYPTLEYEALTLHVQALSGAPRMFRVPFPGVGSARLAVAEREDGTLIAAVAFSDGASGAERAHVRYFGIDTR